MNSFFIQIIHYYYDYYFLIFTFLHSTLNILPGLLSTESYSEVIEILFSRGDEFLNALQEKDENHEMEEVVIRWKNVMSLIEDSIEEEEEM